MVAMVRGWQWEVITFLENGNQPGKDRTTMSIASIESRAGREGVEEWFQTSMGRQGLYLLRTMGSSQFAIPANLSGEWIEITQRGQKLVHNRITQESFCFHRLIKSEQLDTRPYIQRSIYPIPHSPRIIVIDDTPAAFFFLAQVPNSSFKFLLRKKSLLLEILVVLRELVGMAGQLREKYGGFGIRENMIGVLKSEELVMWLNENYQFNEKQYPLREGELEEETMIKSLIGICQTHSKFDLGFLLQQYAGPLTFKQFSKHLAIKIEVEKFRLAQKNIYLAQMQQELAQHKQALHQVPVPPLPIPKPLTRTNTNLKNFDRLHGHPPKAPFKHRRHYTIADLCRQEEEEHSLSPFKVSNLSPPAKSPPARSSHHPTTHPSKSFIPRIPITASPTKKRMSPQPKGEDFPMAMPFLRQQVVSAKNGQMRGTTDCTPGSGEVSFCQGRRIPKEVPWRDDNLGTCSTQQQEFQSREEQRESTICWREQLGGEQERSIVEDYQCLFYKSARLPFAKKARQQS